MIKSESQDSTELDRNEDHQSITSDKKICKSEKYSGIKSASPLTEAGDQSSCNSANATHGRINADDAMVINGLLSFIQTPSIVLDKRNEHFPSNTAETEKKLPDSIISATACNYKDYSTCSIDEISATFDEKRSRRVRMTRELFPEKVHSILEYSEIDGYSSIISWVHHGRAFKIHNYDLFCAQIMPRFFYQTKITSFIGQLATYGFHKIIGESNKDRDTFYHELFLRSRRDVCPLILRLNKRSLHLPNTEEEPDFSKYCPMPVTSPDPTAQNRVRVMTMSMPLPSIVTSVDASITGIHSQKREGDTVHFTALTKKVKINGLEQNLKVEKSGGATEDVHRSKIIDNVKNAILSKESEVNVSIIQSSECNNLNRKLNADEDMVINQLLSLKDENRPSISSINTDTNSSNYMDVSKVSYEEIPCLFKELKGLSPKRFRKDTFPRKLYSILTQSEINEKYSEIISWVSHGRAFKIYDRDLFCTRIMPIYFYGSQWPSFVRQLRDWGFHKIDGWTNPDRDAFFHDFFLRAREDLSHWIIRQKPDRLIIDPAKEPDLTKYEPMPMSSSTSLISNISFGKKIIVQYSSQENVRPQS